MECPCNQVRKRGKGGAAHERGAWCGEVAHVPAWGVGRGSRGHADAVDDGTHTHAQSAASAVLSHMGQVRLGVKGDRLRG